MEMIKEPKISVLMPVYNGERYLQLAIESVLNQTFSDFEFVIIDDGSSDNSVNIIKNIQDSRIVYLRKGHSGLIDTLNFGLQQARAPYIARMDADDISLPNRLEKQYHYLISNRDVVLLGTHATVINEHNQVVEEMCYPPVSWAEVKSYALLHNPFIHSSVMFKKDLVMNVGGYRNFKHTEDYELWTRIIFSHRAENLPEKLLLYRIHGNQVTKKNNLSMRLNGIKARLFALYRSVFKV